MTQQNDGALPLSTQSGGYSQPRRQQPGQPPLLTTVFNRSYGYQPNTSLPSSATSTPLSPMFSPANATFSSTSTSMTSRNYNPRQWSQSGYAESSRTASGASSRGSTRDITGMEASMPSPPPPYTPPTPVSTLRSSHATTRLNNDLYASSPLANDLSSAGQSSSRTSPEAHFQSHFPPPPLKEVYHGRSERESSRSRFSLATLRAATKRPDYAEPSSQPPSPMFVPIDATVRPPAGRRAISTGAITLPSASNSGQSSRRPSPETNGWEPGMPLPPPPPGPPPSNTARAHSLNRYAQQRSIEISGGMLSNVRSPNTHRPSHSNNLGTIPATPVGWVDDDPIPDVQSHSTPQLRINTGVEPATSGTLTRRPATRDPSADSILERRSKSRSGKDTGRQAQPGSSDGKITQNQAQAVPKISNLVLSTTNPLLQRRLAERTGKAQSPEIRAASQLSPDAIRRQNAILNASTLTPPYTPGPDYSRNHMKRAVSDNVATPPLEQAQDSFIQGSLERFHMFIQQEASSPTDRDRLELFAKFMVRESRIRRDRYGSAFSSMAGEIMDLTRDMWRPTNSPACITESRSLDNILQEAPRAPLSPEGSRTSGNVPPTSSCSSTTEFTPATDTESVCGNDEVQDEKRATVPWGERFQPSLSPINSVPSMAPTTVPDDEDSRGRPASRWWEGSAEGSLGREGRKLAMSKQESKYMSLHPQELLVAAQPSPAFSTPTPRSGNTSFRYGADEYPPEKTGLHEENVSNEASVQDYYRPSLPPAAVYRGEQPMMPLLDISRLVTLPPPYPRHYPALHNDHPSLSNIRSKHREITETISIRQSRPQNDASWQASVYTDTVRICESSISELVTRLNETAGSQHTISAQTEGDERPELLEQLTLLKWIFEAREQLQKQDFDASMQRLRARSQAYIEHCMTIGDYTHASTEEDRLNRYLQQNQYSFAQQAMQRFTHLLGIVDRHVSRGVEVQLSAFWDIAPALLEVVQGIPADDGYALANFQVQIPNNEFEDNPSYRSFPMLYLLHTLTHAKKSAYQFIESQTNLLCLLHEVRTASISAEVGVTEIRRILEGDDADTVKGEMGEIRRQREGQETRVLKERVGCLEGQWEEALGGELEKLVDRVGMMLREVGGLDEQFEE